MQKAGPNVSTNEPTPAAPGVEVKVAKPPTLAEQLEAKQALRDARRATAQEAHDQQKLIDLDAIDALEELHGPARVKVIETDPHPGVAALVGVRCPDDSEIQRYRDRIRDGKAKGKDVSVAALIELGKTCWGYPAWGSPLAVETIRKFPGLDSQAGGIAVGLAIGREETQGKG